MGSSLPEYILAVMHLDSSYIGIYLQDEAQDHANKEAPGFVPDTEIKLRYYSTCVNGEKESATFEII